MGHLARAPYNRPQGFCLLQTSSIIRLCISYSCCFSSEMASMNNISFIDPVCIIQTGGTIDKDYPRKTKGYQFEICEPAAGRILAKAGVPYSTGSEPHDFHNGKPVIQEAFRKDSLDITESDRVSLLKICSQIVTSSSANNKIARIVITHGTDTMIETGKFLLQHLISESGLRAVILLTGALLPERFKDSDADFNFGLAMGAAQCLNESGVYIAMGKVIPVLNAFRELSTGRFQFENLDNSKESSSL